ncbi:MAG: nitroreductase family protein [Omnitrophica bacterium]|nr:nitroreductase family protein [Candidatus Omnitrophota bacterium]
MSIRELVLKNRSYRRFFKDAVSPETLRGLVDLARLSPSAANLQPLKYIISCVPKKNALIFPHLKWAGYLKDWLGPLSEERPRAYIVILGDTGISKSFACDSGIASIGILLGATEKGLGGCIIGAIDREGLRAALKIRAAYEILLVLALGKPKEKVEIEVVKGAGDIKYWRDKEGNHHVPKRKLDDLIVE